MMRTGFLLSIALLIVACAQPVKESRAASSSPLENQQAEQQQAISELEKIASGDAISNARSAVAANDWRLWAYHDRAGLKVPGVIAHREDYPVKIAPAMGDVIYNDRHLQAHLQFLDYAKRYNQEVLSLQSKQ